MKPLIILGVLIMLPMLALIFTGYMEKSDNKKQNSGINEFQNFKDAF